jgi:hypothetical protein
VNHTKGIWDVKARAPHVIIGHRGGRDFRSTIAETFGTKQEREANAVMISAAPQLFEALQALTWHYETQIVGSNDLAAVKRARKLLNRVIGGTSK